MRPHKPTHDEYPLIINALAQDPAGDPKPADDPYRSDHRSPTTVSTRSTRFGASDTCRDGTCRQGHEGTERAHAAGVGHRRRSARGRRTGGLRDGTVSLRSAWRHTQRCVSALSNQPAPELIPITVNEFRHLFGAFLLRPHCNATQLPHWSCLAPSPPSPRPRKQLRRRDRSP